MTPKVAISLLIFSSLRVGRGAIDPCSVPPENIAVYEGALNTLIYFPTSPNGVKWTILATTNESTEVTLVNYDDTVDPSYTADYAFNSSGLIVRNATATADYNVHQLSTAGLYTAECGGNQFSFKFLVVRKGPTCSCDRVTSDTVELTCSTIYADSNFDPIAAIFTFYVDGNAVLSDTPQRTSCDGYTWISASTFTTAYSSSSTYECGQTFGQPTEVLDPSVSMNAPEFNQKCPVTASEYDCMADTISPAPISTSPKSVTRMSSLVNRTTPLALIMFMPSTKTRSIARTRPTYMESISSMCTSSTTTTPTIYPSSASPGSNKSTIRLAAFSASSTTSTTPSTTGGLSYGSKIGIGVGIGVGGTLVLVGILFAVLCRRHEITKRAKPDDRMGNAMEENTERSRTNRDNSNTPQYEPLDVLLVQTTNPGPTYEQLTAPTNVKATEQSLPDRSAFGSGCLNADQSCSTNYDGLQQRESMASDVYQSIIHRH